MLLSVTVALVAAQVAWVRPAGAAPVRGTITMPQDLKTARRFRGYWRVENGVVPVAPAAVRADTVVVLSGVKAAAPPARTVTVDISGLQPIPSTVVVGEGSVVELKNSDRVPHDLAIPEMANLMPLERLAPGALRRQKLLAAGGYAIRDAEFPHLVISVVVVNSPFFATVDDKGAFKLPDAPEGRATLKIWSHGRWVHEQEIDVGKSDDLRIKVAARSEKEAPEKEGAE
jgi:hypothetical protein